jgi:hypothetical protein
MGVVEIGSGGERYMVAIGGRVHGGCAGGRECPFDPVPETFVEVKSAASGIKEAFPPLGG